jgi:chromosome segregation ATPase
MKKGLFGYSVSEVDVALGALREENESLNATIVTLKTQIKNSVSDSGAKASLLEADLKKNEENLKIITEEKNDLISQITSLSVESGELHQKNTELSTQIEHLHMQNQELNQRVTGLQSQLEELSAQEEKIDTSVIEALQSQLDAEKEHKTALEQDLNAKIVELFSARDEVAAAASDLVEAQSRIETITNEHEQEKAQLKAFTSDYESMELELESAKSSLEAAAGELEQIKSSMQQKVQEADQAQDEIQILKSQLDRAHVMNFEQSEKLAAISTYADDYNNLKEKLASAGTSLHEKTAELEKVQKEIEQLKDELAIAMVAVDEQAKLKANEKRQLAILNQASEISYQAYYDMSRMRNEVVEYIHEHMKDYYQRVNENNLKMRAAIEQRQLEYNQIIREFFAKASEYRISLSTLDSDYNNMADFNMNIDKLSNRMNEIMDHFVEESNTYLKDSSMKLKKKDDDLKPEEETSAEESSSAHHPEEITKKPFVFKISG